MLIFPVDPAPTTALIRPGVEIINEAAIVPPNRTVSTSSKFRPVIVMVSPVPPKDGLKELIVGGPKNLNPDIRAESVADLIRISPEEPDPITATIVVGSETEKDAAGTPPKLTAPMPEKLAPWIVMLSPVLPDAGVNE